jgi:predicted nucleic acid-binding protein
MLLDSNMLIYGAKDANSPLDAILDRTDLAATSITKIETLGFHRLSTLEKQWLETAFDRMKILLLEEAVAARAIALRQERKMGLADAIIAATALVHEMPLVTRNIVDFKHVARLRLIDPFATTEN